MRQGRRRAVAGSCGQGWRGVELRQAIRPSAWGSSVAALVSRPPLPSRAPPPAPPTRPLRFRARRRYFAVGRARPGWSGPPRPSICAPVAGRPPAPSTVAHGAVAAAGWRRGGGDGGQDGRGGCVSCRAQRVGRQRLLDCRPAPPWRRRSGSRRPPPEVAPCHCAQTRWPSRAAILARRYACSIRAARVPPRGSQPQEDG